MAKKVRKKKKKRVREKDWASQGDLAFSVDRAKHVRTGSVPEGDEEAPGIPEGVAPNGVVVAALGPRAVVKMAGEETLCRVDERLCVGRASALSPGDDVWVEPDQDTHFVRAVGSRRSKLSRVATRGGRVEEQVIAANVDLLVIVASILQPRLKPGLVDRYLIAAEAGGVQPLLCIHKTDLAAEEPEAVSIYRDIDLEVVNTSCVTGEGIEALRGALCQKLSVLAGHSGVGKSSLINALAPGLDIETREVSDYNEKGKHTTSSSRLYEIPGGIHIIDTPGIRRLGVWGVSHAELAFYFPEMEALAAGCRFRDCTHTHEPDCAVRAAAEAGNLPERRYQSYLRIRESL